VIKQFFRHREISDGKAASRFIGSARASRAAVGTLPVWTGSKTPGEFNGLDGIEKIGKSRNGAQVKTPFCLAWSAEKRHRAVTQL